MRKSGSPVHPYYDRAGLRNIAETTRGVPRRKKPHHILTGMLVLVIAILGLFILVALP